MTLFIIVLIMYLNFGSLDNPKLEIFLDMILIVICWILLNLDEWIRKMISMMI